MSKIQLIVESDGSEDWTSKLFNYSTLEEAQTAAHQLSIDWAADGYTKQHEVWVKGEQWRQKIIAISGWQYTEEDGVDE